MDENVRTVLYLYQPSTVTIQTTRTENNGALLFRYPGTSQAAVGTHKLDRGIYMITSRFEMEVTGSDMEVVVQRGGKDIPPDPKLAALALEPGATVKSVQSFFLIAKDISVPKPSASSRPAAPGGSGSHGG